MALEITVETIPHNEQRYETVGDWKIEDDDCWTVTVSAMPDWRHEFLVAIHELVEMALCFNQGVSAESVDTFDTTYTGVGEPGDDPASPYALQHCAAEGVERLLATMLDVKWSEYEATIGQL